MSEMTTTEVTNAETTESPASEAPPAMGNQEQSTGYPANTPVSEMTPDQQATYWRAQSQKHEKMLKSEREKRSSEIESARLQSLSEHERAIEIAKAEGRTAAASDFGQKLAAAEIKAALTGIIPDPSVVVEDLNLAKYVTDTGDVDLEAVTALRAKYQSIAAKTPPPDLNQGSRGGNRVDIDQQIADATAAGNHALAISLKRARAYAPRT